MRSLIIGYCSVALISFIVLCHECYAADGVRQGPLVEALFLGNSSEFNGSMQDCVFRRGFDRDLCPDPDIKYILYTGDKQSGIIKTKMDLTQNDWLRNSGWDQTKDNIILIHGYAGGDDTLPIIVLRDAYINNGGYNVFMVDWGALCAAPCYIASVHNLRPVARCISEMFAFLRYGGMSVERTTCVGHSLGAHLCGIMANFLNFRIHRIIGLDPARPLIRAGSGNRLDMGDAYSVQVIHTNAGYYGEGGQIGHVDFCVNGGRHQPYCSNTTNEALCSHIWCLCYLAQSLDPAASQQAEPCSRRCPAGPRPNNKMGPPILMGQHTPLNAQGSYCLKDTLPPYCPTTPGGPGDVRCCIRHKN